MEETFPMSVPALPALSHESPGGSDVRPEAVYLARLAPGSRRTMRQALERIAGFVTQGRADAHELPWHQLRYAHTTAIRALLAESYAPATVNKMLSALRGVLKECWRLGLMDSGDYQRATDLPSVRGTAGLAGRALTSGELRTLFRVCAEDDSPAGARDAAILGLLYGSGLRRAELVALDLGDLDMQTGAIRIRDGKGRQFRTVYAPPGAIRALEAWLLSRGISKGALFVPIDKAGAIQIRHMTGQAVLYLLKKRARQAGIPGFSPHDLRRTYISDLLDAGADLVTVQRLAGHAQVTTTARYDRRGERVKLRAASLLHVPYSPIR